LITPNYNNIKLKNISRKTMSSFRYWNICSHLLFTQIKYHTLFCLDSNYFLREHFILFNK